MPQECVSASGRTGKTITSRAHTGTSLPLCAHFGALSKLWYDYGCRKVVLAHAREQARKPILQPGVKPAQLQSLRIVERPLAPHAEQWLAEVGLDSVQVCQFCPADLAGLRDVIAHPAGKVNALLLELI